MLHAQPILVEVDLALAAAERAERMDVGIADPPPVAELDAELEGRPGARHEIGFVDAELLVEGADVRQSRLADPDDADRLRFDQLDAAAVRQQLDQG